MSFDLADVFAGTSPTPQGPPKKKKGFDLASVFDAPEPSSSFDLSSLFGKDEAPTVEDKIAALPISADERAQHLARLHRNRVAQAQATNAAEGEQPMGFGESLASSALDAKEHPWEMAKSMVTAPIRSVATFGRAAREAGEDLGVRLRRGDPSTVQHTVSPEQAGLAGAQILSGIAAGPLGPIVGGGLVMASYGAEHARTPQELAAQAALGAGLGAVGHAAHVGGARALDRATDFSSGFTEAGGPRGLGELDYREPPELSRTRAALRQQSDPLSAVSAANRRIAASDATAEADAVQRGRLLGMEGQSPDVPPPRPTSRRFDAEGRVVEEMEPQQQGPTERLRTALAPKIEVFGAQTPIEPQLASTWKGAAPERPRWTEGPPVSPAEPPSASGVDWEAARRLDQARQAGPADTGDFGQYLDAFKTRVGESLNYSDDKFGPGEQRRVAAEGPSDVAAETVGVGQDVPTESLLDRMAQVEQRLAGPGDDPLSYRFAAQHRQLGEELARRGLTEEALHEQLAKRGSTYNPFAEEGDDPFGPAVPQSPIDGPPPNEGAEAEPPAARGEPGGDRETGGLPSGPAQAGSGAAPPVPSGEEGAPGRVEGRRDLFGNAVEPTVEQGGLFGQTAGGTQGMAPGKIDAAEMMRRRDELGVPREAPSIGGPSLFDAPTPTTDVPQRMRDAAGTLEGELRGKLYSNPIAPVARVGARGALRAGAWARDLPPAKKLIEGWNRIFDPAALSPEAEGTAGAMRSRLGEMAGTFERRNAAMEGAAPGGLREKLRRSRLGRAVDAFLPPASVFDKAPDAERFDFMDRMEHGQAQASPALTGLAGEIRKTLDTTRDDIRSLGGGALDDFIENYFPHIWADPQQAQGVFAQAFGQRPLEGSKAFLKERSIPTIKEGLAKGLTPVTTNPVELSLLKLREMQRFLMAQRVLADLKARGLVQLVPGGTRAPAGFTRLHDKIARVPGVGEYWAQDGAAKIVNNYLSPGLRGNSVYDAIHWSGKALNQAQLGLSGFHLGFTSVDAMTSRVALGLEQFAHGKPLTAVTTIASTPLAPVTNYRTGAQVKAAYLNPGSRGADVDVIASWVERAGGRIKMDSFYRNSAPEKMAEAMRRGQWGRFALNTIPGVLQTVAKPIMEWVVPAQKLGVFADLAREAMDQLGPTATREAQDAALHKVWNSVDNRMGQLVYDNLFWNKAFKDLSMAATRSVGWNLGTIRELGGGLGDLAREGTRYVAGEKAELTHRAAYTLALPVTIGMLGAIALPITLGMIGAVRSYLAGKPPNDLRDYFPQDVRDVFTPRTGTFDENGNPNRVMLPGYHKDAIAFYNAPWETAKHKMGPQLALVGQMLDNQDYYGDQIRNPKDPLVQQAQQEAAYVWHAVQPFSFQNARESSKRGDESLLGRYGSQIGITPAPRRMVRSDAENLMADFLAERRVTGATPEDAEARTARRDILAGLRGSTGDLADQVDRAIEKGQLTPPQFARLLKRAGTTPMREQYQRLTVDQAVRVFDAADERQRALFFDLLEKKISNASRQGGLSP